jgi:ribonuclease HII
MDELDVRYPGYGLAKHKGYPTPEHQDAIRELGPSPIHRMSFTFIRELCGEYSPGFYELKQRLAAARSPAEVDAFERALLERRTELNDDEKRKLKLMAARRWKTI